MSHRNGGDPGSLNANFNSYDETASAFRSRIGPSMRFVLDWSNVDAFSIALAFGQSGNPLSPNFDDFFEPSLRGVDWIVPYSRQAAARRAVSELTLDPAAREN